jgi:hypothetical protein
MKKKAGAQDIMGLFSRLREIASEAKLLEQEQQAIRGELGRLIEPGKARAGVLHVVQPHVSVKWSQVYEQVVGRLVPATKRDLAASIKESCTSTTSAHSYKLEAEG